MSTKKFEFIPSIKFGWEKMIANFWLSMGIVAIFALLGIASDKIDKLSKDSFSMNLVLLGIAISLVSLLFQLGVTKITLKIHDNEEASLEDLYLSYPFVFNYFLASIIYVIIVAFGLILLIIPGIIWMIKYQFYPFFILDKGMKPMEAIKASADLTKDAKMDLFLFGLLLFLFNFVGLLCLGVGLLFTIPTSFIAMARVYRLLLGGSQATTDTIVS